MQRNMLAPSESDSDEMDELEDTLGSLEVGRPEVLPKGRPDNSPERLDAFKDSVKYNTRIAERDHSASNRSLGSNDSIVFTVSEA